MKLLERFERSLLSCELPAASKVMDETEKTREQSWIYSDAEFGRLSAYMSLHCWTHTHPVLTPLSLLLEGVRRNPPIKDISEMSIVSSLAVIWWLSNRDANGQFCIILMLKWSFVNHSCVFLLDEPKLSISSLRLWSPRTKWNYRWNPFAGK